MFDFATPISSADLVVLGGLLFMMIVARMLHEESRVASYALIAAVLSDNPYLLYIVPLLAMVTKLVRF